MLRDLGKATSLATIEAHLKQERLEPVRLPGADNTFGVREAVSDLIDEGEAEDTINRKIRLTR
jgi:hypothetical protein